jgi:hypothetical protein
VFNELSAGGKIKYTEGSNTPNPIVICKTTLSFFLFFREAYQKIKMKTSG